MVQSAIKTYMKKILAIMCSILLLSSCSNSANYKIIPCTMEISDIDVTYNLVTTTNEEKLTIVEKVNIEMELSGALFGENFQDMSEDMKNSIADQIPSAIAEELKCEQLKFNTVYKDNLLHLSTSLNVKNDTSMLKQIIGESIKDSMTKDEMVSAMQKYGAKCKLEDDN